MVTDVKIVTGASYGDEGKGMMTAYFSENSREDGQKCLNILHNGGGQRGHTVRMANRRHIFHHMGAGTFAGADTYFTEDFILNPMIFSEEVSCMGGLPENVRLYRHPGCRWSTPYDMIANQIIEDGRGEARHGSCGAGIWETVLRYEKMSAPTADEFARLSRSSQIKFLKDVREYFYDRMFEMGIENIPEIWRVIMFDDGIADEFIDNFMMMTEAISAAEEDISGNYDVLVFEGGQGLLLSESMARIYGSDRYTTPSLTGYENPVKFLQRINYSGDIEVCYVTRSYLTRHGAGPFPGECPQEEINPDMKDLTNSPNDYQGTLRYGKIDIHNLNRRIWGDFTGYGRFPKAVKSAAITHLNETGGMMAAADGMAQIAKVGADVIYTSYSENINEINRCKH